MRRRVAKREAVREQRSIREEPGISRPRPSPVFDRGSANIIYTCGNDARSRIRSSKNALNARAGTYREGQTQTALLLGFVSYSPWVMRGCVCVPRRVSPGLARTPRSRGPPTRSGWATRASNRVDMAVCRWSAASRPGTGPRRNEDSPADSTTTPDHHRQLRNARAALQYSSTPYRSTRRQLRRL